MAADNLTAAGPEDRKAFDNPDKRISDWGYDRAANRITANKAVPGRRGYMEQIGSGLQSLQTERMKPERWADYPPPGDREPSRSEDWEPKPASVRRRRSSGRARLRARSRG